MSGSYKAHNSSGCYFISCAVVGWVDVFTRELYRNIFIKNLNFCIQNKNLEVFAWVLMTNHFHLIVRSKADNIIISEILRDFKKFTAKELRNSIETNIQESRKEWMLSIFKFAGSNNSQNIDFQFWQQDNHPIELLTNEMILQKLNYIHDNPVRAGFVEESFHYPYSSACDYSGKNGKVKITLI